MNVKKRFKEERMLLEKDKKQLNAQLDEYKQRLEIAENKFYSYKKEIDESPLTVLRNELTQKNLTIMDLETKLKNAKEEKEEMKKKFD